MKATHHYHPTIGGAAYLETTHEPQEFEVSYRVPLERWHGSPWQAQLIRWKQWFDATLNSTSFHNTVTLWASGIRCELISFQSRLDDTDPVLGQVTDTRWVVITLKLVEAVEAVK